MWSPSTSAFFSWGDFAPDFSPTLTTKPLLDCTRCMSWRMFSSRMLRSVTTMTESNVDCESALMCRISRWLNHAIVFVLPEPAECQTK